MIKFNYVDLIIIVDVGVGILVNRFVKFSMYNKVIKVGIIV